MSKEKIDLMIEGGKATPNATLSQALGPLKIDIASIIKRINEKTHEYHGMKIPVKVIVDTNSKDVNLELGTPPISELIKQEIKAEKGSGEPNKIKIGNLAFEQVIKIAKMKYEGMHVNNLKAAVKSVMGSCHAMGVMIEGKNVQDVNKDIDNGIYDDLIKHQKTEFSEEKKKVLDSQLKDIQEKIRKELEKAAKEAAAKEEAAKEEKVVAQETETAAASKEAAAESGKEKAKTPEKKEEKKK